MKKYLSVLIVVALVAIAYGGFLWFKSETPVALAQDYKNATYEIDGQRVTLNAGQAHIVAGDDSAPQATVAYFGNAVNGDFNGDGTIDTAFLLTQDNGGSGTFFYAVAALKKPSGYQGTNGIFLGDRIAPQTTEVIDGQIIVNYADRKPTDPMTARPSIGVSKYLQISGDRLVDDTTAHLIADAFSVKYHQSADTFIISVTANDGSYARGTVNYSDAPGGGVWFAARTANRWEIAYDGNGIVPCEAIANFPRTIVPTCIDTGTIMLLSSGRSGSGMVDKLSVTGCMLNLTKV